VSGQNANGFSASSGIRGGRGKIADDEGTLSGDELAVVGRLEYAAVPGLTFGGSAYNGGANQEEDPALDGVGVTILEADIRYRKFGFDLTGVYTQIDIDDAEKINSKNSLTGNKSIGEKLVGWYVEGAYDILRPLALQSEKRLMAFVRYEQINTQDVVPTGFTADPKNDRNVITYGLAYYPITSVAIKADVENWENEAATNNDGNRFNLAVAYMF
jgi:hypothetical protein